MSGIAGAFLWLDRKPRPPGFWLPVFFLLYGPARFAMDFLRIGDATYGGLTPAQFLMIGATAASAWALWRVTRAPSEG